MVLVFYVAGVVLGAQKEFVARILGVALFGAIPAAVCSWLSSEK